MEVIKGDSADSAAAFADESVDFVFIDADHSYAGISRDITAWLPKVKRGGVLAGHDYHSDVQRCVDERFPNVRADHTDLGVPEVSET